MNRPSIIRRALFAGLLILFLLQSPALAHAQPHQAGLSPSAIRLINPYANVTEDFLRLKGQLHLHTVYSDGKLFPADIVDLYQKLGYDFITITDHNRITPSPNLPGITWIADSAEITYEKDGVKHDFTTYDIGEDGIVDQLDIRNMLDVYTAKHKLISYAHPSLSGSPDQIHGINQQRSYPLMEVYNAVVSKKNQEAYWDETLKERRTWGIAVDDAHTRLHVDQAWTVVFVKTNTSAAILSALRNGAFYASNGNDLYIQVNGSVISAISSAPSNFSYIGANGKVLKLETDATESSYTIVGAETYVRVKSERIADGKMAWGQPIFISYPVYTPLIRKVP